MSETINISDTLFNKIKNLFKKMYACYMAYYFRDRTEYGNDDTQAVVEDPAPEAIEGTVDEAEDFADFFDGEEAPAE